MARLNIFASFEFDKDNNLKNSFYAQASKHTRHRVRNCSLNKAYDDEAWKETAREAIRECDVVFVLVGQDTHNAPGVLVETDMAQSFNRPTIQVLSEKARRNRYRGVPNLEDRIPWEVECHQQKIGRGVRNPMLGGMEPWLPGSACSRVKVPPRVRGQPQRVLSRDGLLCLIHEFLPGIFAIHRIEC